MGNVVVFSAPRTVGFETYEDRPLQPHEVRLRTLYSGISAGTELTAYRGSNPYLHKQWDPDRKLFVPAEQPSLTYPVSGWGYEEVGEVIEREMDFAEGSWIIPTGQPLGRLVTHMLEVETEDNVIYWNTMDEWLPKPNARAAETQSFAFTAATQQDLPLVPIYKIMTPTTLPTRVLP